MGGNRDWKARGGPRGLYSLPLPLIRVEPAPPGPSGCSQAKGLPGRAAEQSYRGGLVLLARERVPNGVPHLRPLLWQVRAESPPSARGHGSPPGAASAAPGGPKRSPGWAGGEGVLFASCLERTPVILASRGRLGSRGDWRELGSRGLRSLTRPSSAPHPARSPGAGSPNCFIRNRQLL